MTTLIDDDPVLQRVRAWAEAQDDIRAALLTSTRAIPGASVDALSDYDINLVVRDVAARASDRGWIDAFGEVLIAYWDPVETDPATGLPQSGNIVQYADGLKIDVILWSVGMLEHLASRPSLPAELDAGYRVLLDKDGLADALPAPTGRGYTPDLPDRETYLQNVNDFFVGVPYVAKCLVRDELRPAKWVLDYDMRYVYLLPMLVWRMECDHDWSISLGVNGRCLKRHLPPDLWAEFEMTFTGAGIEENRDALFRMIAFYGRIAREVAAHLGYDYPDDLDHRVTALAREMLEAPNDNRQP
jgi:aminoglycoside 6-adenylyltransferase